MTTTPLATAPSAEHMERWPQTGRHILAHFDDETIIVYQAYGPNIARFAVEKGFFGGDFKYSRMSWIKPNFLWMMGKGVGSLLRWALCEMTPDPFASPTPPREGRTNAKKEAAREECFWGYDPALPPCVRVPDPVALIGLPPGPAQPESR